MRRDYDFFTNPKGLGVCMEDEDTLFNVLESNLDTGLRGIPVGTCQTSYVDPIEGVHYVGYPVEDLVNLEEEDVIYLLLFKELPTPEQSEKFRAELALRGESLPTEIGRAHV